MTTPYSEDRNGGAKIIAMSILSGFGFLGFILSCISKQEGVAVFAAMMTVLFLYYLVCAWFTVHPIRSTLNWIAGYDSLENRVQDEDLLDSSYSNKSG